MHNYTDVYTGWKWNL